MADRIPPALLMQNARIMPVVDLSPRAIAPLARVNNADVDRGYWYGYAPEPERRTMGVNVDAPVYPVPVMAQMPRSTDPQSVVWFNANCPPWVCPAYWSVSVDQPISGCVPWYEVDTLLGGFRVPGDRFYVIRQVSYEALNAAADDVFEWSISVDGKLVARWEDIGVDVAQANPAHKYGLSGHTRMLPLWFIADRNSSLNVHARLRGAIDLAGNSPNFPGQPILTGNCLMKILLQGWLSPLRENRDGGPRPTDLGDLGFIALDDDQSGWQA